MGNLDAALAPLRAHFDLLLLGGLLFGLVLLARLLVTVSGIRYRLRTELGDQRALLREVRETSATTWRRADSRSRNR